MKNEHDIKECFGEQGEDVFFGDPPYKCLKCDVFDECHKMTVATCLQSIKINLDLFIDNGLTTKKLMGYKELNKLAEIDMKKKH